MVSGARAAWLVLSVSYVHASSLRAPTPTPSTTGERNDAAGLPLLPLIASITAGGGAAAFAIPGTRRAVSGLLRRIRGADDLMADDLDDLATDERSSSEAAAAAEARSERAADGGSQGAGQLVLSPERLSVISERSSLLAPMAEQLSVVPVFMVTLNGSTTPLSVRAPEGGRLAYFFLEYTDADFFRKKVVEQKAGMEASVAALSLADVVRAYSTPAAAEAKENFVAIPTMKAVIAARALLKAKGDDESGWDSKLSAASGLVPVFWIQAMASQTESGKQRKIIFFRPEDALNMWANISVTNAQAEGVDPPTEPPEILVADLQTLCAHLAESDQMDDVVFAPSSAALRIFARPPAAGGADAGIDGTAEEALAGGGAPSAGGGAFDDDFLGEEDDED